MAQAGKHYSIEALNGNNYHNWKFRMEMILAENNVLGCIEKDTNVEDIIDEKEKAAKVQLENKAKSLIIQCVNDNQLECLRDKKTAFKMWMMLKDRYEKQGLPGQLYLKKKLLSMKLKENESLEKFILEFEEITRQLKAAGSKIAEEDLVCNILLSLPKSYEAVVTVLENIPNITFEMVKKKILAEYEKRKLSEEPRGSANTERLYALSLQKGSCFRCGEVGHFKRDCRKVFNQRDSQRDRNSSGSSGYHRGTFRGTNYNRQGRSKINNSYRHSNFAQNNRNSDKTKEGDKSVCFMSETNSCNEKTDLLRFYIDSGCTDHMVSEKSCFTDLMMLENPIKIAVAKNDSFLLAMGVGNIEVFSNVRNEKIKCKIANVLYVPQLRKNLLSVKKLEMYDVKVIFENGQVKLTDKKNRILGIGTRKNLYEISFEVCNAECLNIENYDNDFMKWHKRYAHIGFTGLKEMIKRKMVIGIDENIKLHQVEFCEPCVSAKMTRLPFGKRTKSKRILEIIHSDICGPITPETFDGCKYFVTFIDDFSNFTAVYLVKQKSEVFEKFREFVNMAESKFNCKVSKLRCDNGGEYTAKAFIEFCKMKGIVLDYTVPYTPQQNGKAERKNRSLVERSRAMIEDSGIPKEFWGEAIRTVNYVMNRGISANMYGVTPAELWYGYKPDVSNLKVFGCVAHSHIPKELRTKLDTKTEKCVMLGYAPTGYRLWDVKKEKIIISRDVEFDENKFYFKNCIVEVKVATDKKESVNTNEDEEKINQDKCVLDENLNESNCDLSNRKEKDCKRKVKIPSKYNDYELYMAFDAIRFVEDAPMCFKDLQNRVDRGRWIEAVNRELNSIEENDTWMKVRKPENVNILDTKWLFTYKTLEEKEVDKYKARLVVRGFAQEKDKTYDDIYSPVARMATIRALLIFGNQFKHFFHQLDVKTAFLNAELNENIYIYPPEGVECDNGEVFKLKKSLYGLKQASRCWNDEINNFLLKIGFTRSENDYCLYTLNCKSGKIVLLIYVDDIILTGPELAQIIKIKNVLMKNFKMRDKGDLKYFLGLEICYDRDKGIFQLNQSKYTQSLLKKFNMTNCKTSEIPIDPKLKIELCNDPIKKTQKPFQELVGCLMYLMLGTRPDICFAVNYFSRFQDKATDEAWNYLIRVLRYLKHTVDVGLEFKRNQSTDLCCYVDADWGMDVHDRKSVTGFVLKVYGSTLMWGTRKQNCVSLSTTEAELVALCTAVCEGLWLRKLFCDFGISFETILYYEDNQGCIALVKNPINNRRVKHIDLKYNFVSEYVKKGIIHLVYIETSNQEADIFTKGLSKIQFVKLRDLLGLRYFSEGGCYNIH